jgi:hypothetical protein
VPDHRPALRLLSLGAGVQSTTVLLVACEGAIPRFDAALFTDTGRSGSGEPARPDGRAGSFGHPGSGGSVGFADPGTGVGFGYATSLWNFRPDDLRATNLANAVRSCLG